MLIGMGLPDRYLTERDYPGSVLAHSTHLKGIVYDQPAGIETSRFQVTLATSIFSEHCRRINLGYLDLAAIDPKLWEDRESDGVLVVRRAGEMLNRVRESNHEI